MPDLDAITTAIAARYAAAQVTPPPGYQNVRLATADLPNEMGPLPAVFVIPTEGDFRAGNGTRIGGFDFVVRFYYSQGNDLPRDLPALRKWLTVLADQHRTSIQLGGIVTSVRTLTWRLATLTFASVEYSGLELGVHAETSEGWAVTA